MGKSVHNQDRGDLQALIQLITSNDKTTRETMAVQHRALITKVDSEFFIINENQKATREAIDGLKEEIRRHNGRLGKAEDSISKMKGVCQNAEEHIQDSTPMVNQMKMATWIAKNGKWIWIPALIFLFFLTLIANAAYHEGWLPIFNN